MALEDRDRTFDKALSRHLRADAGPGASANLRPEAAGLGAKCLDPETLAAYHERSLLPEEMNSAKEHIVACEHCQSILAQLEVTDSISLEAAGREKMPVLAAASPKPHSPVPIRGPRWAWLVPAGALAASLLVWIGYRENQRMAFVKGGSEIKMAKAQEPPLPSAPQDTRQATTSSSMDRISELSQNGRTSNDVAKGAVEAEINSLKQREERMRGGRVAPPKAAVHAGIGGNEKELRKDALRDSSAIGKAETRSQLDDKSAAVPQVAEQVQVQVQAQAPNTQTQYQAQNQTQNQTQNQLPTQRVLGPPPYAQAEASKKAKSDSPSAYRPSAAPATPLPAVPSSASVAGFNASDALEMAVPTNPHLISVPGLSLIWRAGRAGMIEFSSDSGASWVRQTSGVLTDLTTGAAPSASVCWIVGRVGTILRTVDGGAHWTLLHAPLSEDLGGIHAVDRLHATIWNSRNTKSFETADGGITWAPVPAP